MQTGVVYESLWKGWPLISSLGLISLFIPSWGLASVRKETSPLQSSSIRILQSFPFMVVKSTLYLHEWMKSNTWVIQHDSRFFRSLFCFGMCAIFKHGCTHYLIWLDRFTSYTVMTLSGEDLINSGLWNFYCSFPTLNPFVTSSRFLVCRLILEWA